MASAHAPCPRAIHVVYPDSRTRHLTCTPHPTRLLLAPTALWQSSLQRTGLLSRPHCRWHSAPCPPAIYISSSCTSSPAIPPTLSPLTSQAPSHVPAEPLPPTCARATYSSSRLPRTHPTVIRNTTDALTPHEQSPSPHRGRSLPRTSARVHVPCVCRASRQHQLRAIDRSARRTRRSSVDGGRAEEM